MRNLPKRIATLSPDKRQLLERMLKKEGLSISPEEPVTGAEEPSFNHLEAVSGTVDDFLNRLNAQTQQADEEYTGEVESSLTGEIKAMTRKGYNAANDQLNSAFGSKYSIFLNLGYISDESRDYSGIQLPAQMLNRSSVKLVLELVGDFDITGCEVLDVGCGRGGTIHTINQYFEVKSLTGIDLSGSAISFCGKTHASDRMRFLEGDAERLPFDSGSFDVVTNVESSHNYPNLFNFYRGVIRVLKKGGYFLYTDIMPTKFLSRRLDFFREIGFSIERNRDITNNVLLSCDESANRHLRAFNVDQGDSVIHNFLSSPSSDTYKDMKIGKLTYRIMRLKKA
ncbi:MAG: class I SAM-dependent methyltransferase [Blastocatellia bacterium]